MTDGTPKDATRWARRTTVRPGLRVTLAVVAAFLYGWALGRIPAPTDPAVFWIGNLAGPYAIIGFLAGAWAVRRPLGAALAGAAAAMAAVAGFYNFFAIGNVTNVQLGVAPTVTASSVVLRSYGRWLANMLWGDPGGTPWLTIALVCGLLFGVLGQRWQARRARTGIALLGAALMAEPLVYLSGANTLVIGAAYGTGTRNLAIWGVEFAVGVVLLVRAVRFPRARGTSPAGEPDGAAERRTEAVS